MIVIVEKSNRNTRKKVQSVIIGQHLDSNFTEMESNCAVWGLESHQTVAIISHQRCRWLSALANRPDTNNCPPPSAASLGPMHRQKWLYGGKVGLCYHGNFASTSCRAPPSKFGKYESGSAASVWNLLDFPTYHQHLCATIASVRNNAASAIFSFYALWEWWEGSYK